MRHRSRQSDETETIQEGGAVKQSEESTVQGQYRHIKRTFGPVYNQNSKVLILGSFPSIKSREANFYYGHPQNRFWPLMGKILCREIPTSIEDRKTLMLDKGIALWDTIEECDIVGSSDASIRNIVPVDIQKVLKAADIAQIYCNGSTSHDLFMRYLEPVCGRKPVKLPSTSPANAAWNIDRLYEVWKQIEEYL